MKGIYDFDRKYERRIEKIERSHSVSDRNKKFIFNFKDACFAEGLSKGRIIKYLWLLQKLAKLFKKDFDKVERKDIVKVISKIERMDYSEATKREFSVALKKFYKWLEGNGRKYPEKVEWLKTTMKKNDKKLPEDMLTAEDVKKLIKVTDEPRDGALIAVLYESGCRIGELLSMKIKHITFDKYGAILLLNGKTGSRRVRIVFSSPYLKEWVNKHPLADDPEAPVWILKSNKGIVNYHRARRIIKQLAKMANVKKAVNPHNFRHSRATYLANHLTEAQMCEYLGWTQGSDQPATYVHLSGRDTDDAILKIHGIKRDGKEKDREGLKLEKCPRCFHVNLPTDRFCSLCGEALNEEARMHVIKKSVARSRADKVLDELIKDSEVRKMLEMKIEKLLVTQK